MADINNDELRYGTSALDIKYKEYAINDELLVDGNTGKMYYKRESDGQIVFSDSQDYTITTAISDMNIASFDDGGLPSYGNDILIYDVLDISGKTDMFVDSASNSVEFNCNYAPILSIQNRGLFIRVRGNSVTNAVTSYIQTWYNSRVSGSLSSVHMEILFSTDTVTEVVIVECNFNELVYIPYPITITTTPTIRFKSLYYPSIRPTFISLSSRVKEYVKSLNMGNTKLEASSIDVIYYSSDLDYSMYVSNSQGIRPIFTVPVSDIDQVVQSENAIIDSTDESIKYIMETYQLSTMAITDEAYASLIGES